MNCLRLLAIWLILICPTSIFAASDIELISIGSLNGTDFAPPRSTIQIAMTYRNNGPDIAEFAGVSSQYFISRGFRTIALFTNANTPPCIRDFNVIKPGLGQPLIGVSGFSPRIPLAPGGIVTCICDLDVYAEAPALIEHLFRAVAVGNIDPNPSNNTKIFILRTANNAVPVPLSGYSFGVMAMLLLSVGSIAVRRASSL